MDREHSRSAFSERVKTADLDDAEKARRTSRQHPHTGKTPERKQVLLGQGGQPTCHLTGAQTGSQTGSRLGRKAVTLS